MKLVKIKGNHFASESRIDCLCQEPDEIAFDQRQLYDLGSRNSVASAFDPMKPARVKGNHMTLDVGIQLPLPLTR